MCILPSVLNMRTFGLNATFKIVWVVPIYYRTYQSLWIPHTGSVMLFALCMRHHASANLWVIFFSFWGGSLWYCFLSADRISPIRNNIHKKNGCYAEKKNKKNNNPEQKYHRKARLKVQKASVHTWSVSRSQLLVTVLIEKMKTM